MFLSKCVCVCPAVCWTVWACTSTLYPTSAASRSSSSFRLRSWWWLVAPARRTEASRSHMAMGCYGSKLVTTKIKPSEYAPRRSLTISIAGKKIRFPVPGASNFTWPLATVCHGRHDLPMKRCREAMASTGSKTSATRSSSACLGLRSMH